MNKPVEDQLMNCIAQALVQLETDGEIVIVSSSEEAAARKIHDAVLAVVPKTSLTASELYGVRSLVLHAISNDRCFDWETPTLTGFTEDEFREIAEKLPRE